VISLAKIDASIVIFQFGVEIFKVVEQLDIKRYSFGSATFTYHNLDCNVLMWFLEIRHTVCGCTMIDDRGGNGW
jgi:hypothetical protein